MDKSLMILFIAIISVIFLSIAVIIIEILKYGKRKFIIYYWSFVLILMIITLIYVIYKNNNLIGIYE